MKIDIKKIWPILLFALLLCCGETKSNSSQPPAVGFSGMAQLNENSYLVVHDHKSYKEGSRFGLVEFNREESYRYSPLTISNLSNGQARPSDLESICKIPGRENEFLAAESGSWKGTEGRIFHIKYDTSTVQIVKILTLPLLADNSDESDGDNFEGLACVAMADEKILLLLGERGGSKKYPQGVIRWGYYNLADRELNWPAAGLTGVAVSSPELKSDSLEQISMRSISDLLVDNSGRLWAVATSDMGDFGPFNSVIYQVARLEVRSVAPIAINDNPGPGFIVSGFKVEALAAPLKAISGSLFLIGTEDENYGGVIRSL